MKTHNRILAAAAALLCFAGCEEEPEFKTTDVGPVMSVVSLPQKAYMGGGIPFEVSMQDPIALSTLKAQLYFDEEMVSEVTIRTKQNGTYKDTLEVPF